MEATNHECYVSLETAKLAKQAGFDWAVNRFMSYHDDCDNNPYWTIPIENSRDFNNYQFKHISEAISIPTQSVLQRWLREEHNYHIIIVDTFIPQDNNIKLVWEVLYGKPLYGKPNSILRLDDEQSNSIVFDTYEEALEAGLQKCLTLIIDKQ